MKITGKKTTLYRSKLSRRMGDANSPAGRVWQTGCVVELETNEGITGIGIGGVSAPWHVERLTDQILMGEDPRGVTGLWQRMVESHFHEGYGGLTNEAISILDIALWDLKAKANGEPLWKALGGARPSANAYAGDIGLPMGDEEIFDWYSMMAHDFGLEAGKLKVGLDQAADMRRLGLMQKALSQVTAAPALMIDADEYWSPKQSIRKIREMEQEYDLTWVEAPARRWDFLGMKRVSNGIHGAVCNSELLGASQDYLPYFHHHAADIVQVNMNRCGITGALQLADAAYGFELPITLAATPGNIHAHLATVMPYFMNMEVVDPIAPQGFFTTDVRIEKGRAVVGDKPGNGLVIDPEAFAGAAVDFASVEFHGRRVGAGLYEVIPSEDELATAAKGREK